MQASCATIAASRFQSTLPARGATCCSQHDLLRQLNFNPRSPHGERHYQRRYCASARSNFNPRSPHGERHCSGVVHGSMLLEFQSTLPARGATQLKRDEAHVCNRISIHAPRTGSDIGGAELLNLLLEYFNPRSPHGERRIADCAIDCSSLHFNPRSPHGERHATLALLQSLHRISIHAPRTGSDAHSAMSLASQCSFQSTLPARGATRKVTILSIRIIGFAQKVYHKTVLLRISLAENAVILPEKPRNPVRTSLQKAGGLRFARAIRAARPYSISSPSGA